VACGVEVEEAEGFTGVDDRNSDLKWVGIIPESTLGLSHEVIVEVSECGLIEGPNAGSSGRGIEIGGGRVSWLIVVYIRGYMGRGYSRGIKIKRLGLVGGRRM